LLTWKIKSPCLRGFQAFCDYSSSSAFIRNPFANALFYCICGNSFVLIELICICFSILVNSFWTHGWTQHILTASVSIIKLYDWFYD